MKLFAAISKVDEESRMVWGYASTGARDSQDEIVTQDAIKAAWADYMQFANVREMHQPSAVGVVKEYTFDETGLFIGTHIVDDAAWTKVMAGVYKGFSIGGKKLPGGYDPITKTITALKLTEISLVDRPANPEALITMFKLADNPEGAEMQKNNPAQTAPASAAAQKPEDELLDLMSKGDLPVDKLLAFAKGLLVTVQVDGQGDNTGVNIDPDKAVGGNAVSNTPATPVGAAGVASPKAGETSASMSGAAISATEKDPKDPTNSSNLSNKPNAAKKADACSPLRKSMQGLASKGDDVAKGMYDVSELAELLSRLRWIVESAAFERSTEGDASTVPDQLAAAALQLGTALVAMAQEEVAELIRALPTKPTSPLDLLDAVIANCEAAPKLKKFNDAVSVLKAGARNSAADADRMQQAHDLLVDLGVTCKQVDPAADATKADPVGEVAKAAVSTAQPDLQALSETVAELQKSFGKQGDELKKAHETIAELKKAVGAQPSTPKAALHAVGKDGVAQTIAAADSPVEIESVLKQDGTVDELATAVKKVHLGGGRLTLGQR